MDYQIPKYEDVGHALIHDMAEDFDPGSKHPWGLAITIDPVGERPGTTVDLEEAYVSPGVALDALIKWAKDRGLEVSFGIPTIRRKVS